MTATKQSVVSNHAEVQHNARLRETRRAWMGVPTITHRRASPQIRAKYWIFEQIGLRVCGGHLKSYVHARLCSNSTQLQPEAEGQF
jgi:hypothetical protein